MQVTKNGIGIACCLLLSVSCQLDFFYSAKCQIYILSITDLFLLLLLLELNNYGPNRHETCICTYFILG